ncbi:helix-turn-helix transcriptional regulator [Falsiroseomonas sp. HW251]|uniref:helix-turn-helix transcriptional regulator n=1 Tax=Falsiroseomonas sp. HW251 TaxID=3390998 RepID=UPI003D323896
MAELPAQQFSALIGAIYDCAMAPERWPDALRQVCEALDCVASQLYLLDLETGRHSFATGWGEPPEATRLLVERYQGPSSDWQRQALAARPADADPDEPFVLRRLPHAEELVRSDFFRGWAGTLGYCDAITAVVLQEDRRVGLLGSARHESVGVATDREVALMRLLAPHLRRAVAIGNMLDMRALEAAALRDAMDGLAVGVGVVAADGAILHANAAARAMMADAEGPIRDSGGRLAARRPEATAELLAAIGTAQRDESRLGRQGLGVVLGSPARAERASVAHVLPLTGGQLRPGLVPRAAAAVFVAPAVGGTRLDIVSRALDLTPAESRVLERLIAGETLVQAARSLTVAESTAKTHLSRILAKAGVTRQADLLALVARLAPPVEGG